MKKHLLLIGLSIFILPCLYAQAQKEQYLLITNNIIRMLKAQQYDSIPGYFDSTMQRRLGSKELEQTMDGLATIYGELESEKQTEIEESGTHWVSKTPLQFSKTLMILSLSFNEKNQVAGLFISPPAGSYVVPGYVKNMSFLETKMDFGTEGWKINGTLTYPKDQDKHPLVIIVHGSGPMDRDGTTGNAKIYRDLAWGLASKGVAVFRYEKRSKTHALKLYTLSRQGSPYTPKDEVIDDVLDAIRLLSNNSHVDPSRIYIAAHSQGGMMAPEIAKESGKLKGMIMMAANARPLQDLLLEQLSYLYDGQSLSYTEYEQMQKLKQQATFSKQKNLPANTPVDSLPFNVPAAYWNYLNQYDQVKTFEKLTLPVLILQGERDYQVTMTDFNLWKKAAVKRKGQTDFRSYPKLNHLFIAGEGRSTPAEYQRQGNMDETVVNDIVNWISVQK